MNRLENIEIVPFPDFENIFESYSNKEKYVFLPLASIVFQNHSVFGNRQFHFISIWDTGSYENSFFNDYRKEIRILRFKTKGNKYWYPREPIFPFIDCLPEAYGLIEKSFNNNLEYYLTPKNYIKFSVEDDFLNKEAEIAFNAIRNFDKFELKYYFSRITKYFYTKKKFELYGKINSSFTYSETFIGLTTTREQVISEFHNEGSTKDEIINNLLDKPHWLQNPEQIISELNLVFIGSIDESTFTDGTAEIYLFWDKVNDEVYHFFQWT